MWMNEKAKEKSVTIRMITAALSLALGFIAGIISFVDYNFGGIFMILVFYFFRERKWWNFLAQLVLMIYINVEVLSGFYYDVEIFGMNFEIVRQGFAVFALIPIWLYQGKQGFYNKTVKAVYYWFYPVHLLALWAIREIIWFLA